MPHSRCRRCKEGETLDKPLFGCVRCGRCYHSACHRPHPREPTNWVCKRCLAGHLGLAKRRHYNYHDNSLLSSRAASSSSASPGLGDTSAALKLKLNAASMATAAAAAAAIGPDPGQQQSDSAGFIINCSFTGCPAKIDGKRQVVCEAHLQAISKTDGTRDPGPVRENGTHGTHATPVSAGPTSPRNPRKLLPETDKDRPFMRRKTAGNPPQFIAQQPTPKHSAPSSRGESAMSPPSQPRTLAPRPSVCSPPASPGSFQDGGPLRKRLRRSSSPGRSPRAKVNETALSSRPSATESSDKAVESASPQSSRRALNHSPQRPGSVREKDIKPPSKLNYRHPVRRMPLQLSNLRFIDGPGESMQGVLSEQSSSGLNGSAGNVPRRTSAASDSSRNGAVKGYWAKKLETSNPTPPATRPAPTDSTRHTRRRSELPNGQHHKVLPDRRKSEAQSPYGPFQANGAASSKPPQIHMPIKPAQITKPVQLPPNKEIDTARFDALIYAQEGASSPPPDIDIALPALPKKTAEFPDSIPENQQQQLQQPPQKDEPLYLPIDPRTHWPQPHSASWHAAKQAEIQSRGRKKANFGRAVQSLRRQNLQSQQQVQGEEHLEEASLPDKILENPAWVRALRRLRGETVEGLEGSGGSAEASGAEEPGPAAGRGRRQTGAGGIVGKRVGNSGVVVVTGLNGAQMGVGKREGH